MILMRPTAFFFRKRDGSWCDPTGHQQAVPFNYYILSALTDENSLPPNPYLVKTTVTTEL